MDAAQGLGRRLAREVDLNAAVYRRHAPILGYHKRAICIVYRPEIDEGVFVQEPVGILGPHAEGGDGLSPIDVLSGIVNDPGLHQIRDPVGEELGVDAEVLFVGEVREDRVGDRPVAHLDRGAVLDHPRDVASDPLGDLPGDRVLIGQKRLVVVDEVVDVLDADEPVTVDSGHVGVDLGDDDCRRLDRRFDDVDADPQAHEAVPVGR